MKKELVLGLLLISVLLISGINGCTPEVVKKINETYAGINDYSATVIEKNMFGNVTQNYSIIVKRPDYIKIESPTEIYLQTESDIQRYDKTANVLYKYITEEQKELLTAVVEIDFASFFLQLEDANVDVESAILNNHEVYKITIEPKVAQSSIQVFWFDKTTFFPIKFEKILQKKSCQNIIDFFNEYTDMDLEFTECTDSIEYTNLKINQGISEALFTIDVPETAIIKTQWGGRCNPRRISAKEINKASFNVLWPSYIPKGLEVYYEPEHQDDPSDVCPPHAYLLGGTCVFTGNIFVDYEIAQIILSKKVDTIYTEEVYDEQMNLIETKTDTISTPLKVILSESTSPFNHFRLTNTNPKIKREEVIINGQKGIYEHDVQPYGFDYERGLIWKSDNLYLTLFHNPICAHKKSQILNRPTDEISGRGLGCIAESELSLTKEDLIKIAESI